MSTKVKTKHLSLRLNILFLITFVLFSALIFRLGMVQIVQGEEYADRAEQSVMRSVSVAAPRGLMMDRHGELIVDNEPIYTVTYSERTDVEQDEEEIAERLSEIIDMEADEIYDNMQTETGLAPKRIKQDISVEQMFKVSEHLDEIPGVDVMVDSARHYVHGDLFRTFLGSVGPIPSEQIDEYMAKGYEMNELVGRNQSLERQYEEQLRGKPSETEIEVDRAMRPIGEPDVTPGERGNDLVLTIDVELQQYIEEVIEQEIDQNDNIPQDNIAQQPLFVAMNPNTGEILGMSNNIYTYSRGAYDPGSTVKMASVLMGLHEGVVGPHTQILDRRGEIDFPGFRPGSWRDLGHVNAYEAIQRSSNIYMAQVGLRMMGETNTSAAMRAFEKVRSYNAQFGLGTATGIDLPDEHTGTHHHPQSPVGDLMQNMFGQHDHYTVLQLAQYASTIANGGYRMEPYLVKEIRRGVPSEGEVGQVIWQKEPKILNRVDMSDEHLNVVQRGMEMVTQTSQGTASQLFGDMDVTVAAKTGTAQAAGGEYNHALLVGYAPADDPQIAFASLVPFAMPSQAENVQSPAQTIAKDVLEYYFDLKEDEGEDE